MTYNGEKWIPEHPRPSHADKGKKFDSEKLPYNLLPWPLVEEAVRVLQFGAKKYGEENWKQVANGEKRYWSASIRHLVALKNGEQLDSETGLSHYAHAICSCFFAWWHSQSKVRRKIAEDDGVNYEHEQQA